MEAVIGCLTSVRLLCVGGGGGWVGGRGGNYGKAKLPRVIEYSTAAQTVLFLRFFWVMFF